MRSKSIYLLLLAVLTGCSTAKTVTGEKAFVGTIVYHVEIEGLSVNQDRIEESRSIYGTAITTSYLKNGDVLTQYSGNSNGVEMVYLDLETSNFYVKNRDSDTLHTVSARKTNLEKLNDLRSNELEHEKVVGRDCTPKGYYLHDKSANKGYNQYLTLKYWYSSDVLVDPSLYSEVSTDLTGKLLSDSRGGVILKKTLDYYSHKIVITAHEVQAGEVPDVRWIRKAVILP